MKQQQRRVFLKVIAVSPLIGCAGADPSAPTGFGGGPGNAVGGSGGTGGHPAVSGGGNPSLGGGGTASLGGGGNQSLSGGTSTGGSPVSSGGAPAASGASSGGSAGGAVVNPNDPATPIGNVSAFPLGSFSIAGSIYFLGRDAGGLYAMSMQCTHAGCTVEMQGTQLYCPCHFSRFDHSGSVLAGPAKTPLPHYKVSVDGTGNITVDRFTIVSTSARTPV